MDTSNKTPKSDKPLASRPEIEIILPVRVMPPNGRYFVAEGDCLAADEMSSLLRALGGDVVRRYVLEGDECEMHPSSVIICGPDSLPTAHDLMKFDPVFGFEKNSNDEWRIFERDGHKDIAGGTANTYGQAVAYLGRLPNGNGGRAFVIAALHDLGALAGAHYIVHNLQKITKTVGDEFFSMVIEGTTDGMDISESSVMSDIVIHDFDS